MSGGALLLIGVGAVLLIAGAVGVLRKAPLELRKPDSAISLIEAAVSVVDRDFVPSGETRIERGIYQLICWFGVFAGATLVGVGLWYNQNS